MDDLSLVGLFAGAGQVSRGAQLLAMRRPPPAAAGSPPPAPSTVLHAIADHVVDDYVTVADAVQNDSDQVETDVFSPHSPRNADAGRIYQLKRELLELKRAVVPLARPLDRVATEPRACIDKEIQAYFRDVADYLTRVTEHITAFDSLLDSILQAHLAQVTVAQNEDMRKITAWAAIIAVPTMVCGVYGMNFDHMPELRWRFGYPSPSPSPSSPRHASSSTEASNATAGCSPRSPDHRSPSGSTIS